MTEDQFDELLKDVREESATDEDVAAAKARVRERLTGPSSQLCAKFQADLDAYLKKNLEDAPRLLLEDHLGRCTDCRQVLADAKGKPRIVARRKSSTPQPAWVRWAIAASLLLIGLFLGRDQIDQALAAPGPRATVVSVSGDAYVLPQDTLLAGASLFEEDVIRTGAGAHVVLALADGSRLEVNQRTKLSVHAAWSGQTVRLDYGDVLMQAAKQRRGRLRVVTRDSVASVKGTIFAVSSATSGSLVSVVEGAVAVSQPGMQKVLTPGQQAASSSALASVGLQQALAWSEDKEKYFSLLAEFMRIEEELAQSPGPAMRMEARLLAYLPTSTRAYLAIPNLHGTIDQAVYLLNQRAAENPTLNEWWSSEQVRELRQAVDQIQAVTPLLGDELVFLFVSNPAEESIGMPLVMAEVQTGREDELRTSIDDLLHMDNVSFEVVDGLLLISDSAEHLTMLNASLGGGASSDFAAEIAQRYESGVSWLTAVDVAAIGSAVNAGNEAPQILGLPTMRYLFFENRADGGADRNEATLSFSQERTGMASWLASPGPAGSAEYVSSDALMAFSSSLRDPRQAFDEILLRLGEGSGFARSLAEFQTKTGISIGLDIAASLGTDVTFAVERPTILTPGWILALEATNPGALDETARRLADAVNQDLAAQGRPQSIIFAEETVNGRNWKSFTTGNAITVHWTYDRGYLIASMDRALAARAIAVRESGSPLIRSTRFQQRFPASSGVHHSGFFWFDARGAVADFASQVESPALQSILSSREPLLVVFDGEAERIHAASRTRLTGFLLDTILVSGITHSTTFPQP